MDELTRRLELCERALGTLDEVLTMPFSVIVRDAAIQRFEYSFETTWKLLKAYLDEHHGIVGNSPKQCFRGIQRGGLLSLSETESCLEMSDDRNLTAHTYILAIAEAIFRRLPAHFGLMKKVTTLVGDQIRAEQTSSEKRGKQRSD